MTEKKLNPHRFCISGKDIEVYPSLAPKRPVIYLNTFQKDGVEVYKALSAIQVPDFTLVVISGLEWNHDMTPWAIPPISKNDTPCTGGANAYLELMTKEIIPEVERLLAREILWRGLTGYSLAGLFALYAIYQTNLFSRIASVSGSLWFPGFQKYVLAHEMKIVPERLYLSLGDKESQTRNSYLKKVQQRTAEIHAFYQQKDLKTIYQLNPGNHFQNTTQRTASGIEWLLAK